ncbi:MAG: type III pantothenate kinase [Planctomycetes bacterium]|nr:type III pantothenate kinase [Planctomycetota bacterium]
MTEIREIPHVLACDVGNSAIHLAHVCGEEVTDFQSIGTGELDQLAGRLAELWRRIPEPRRLVACSVNPPALERLEEAAGGIGQDVLLVGRELPLPIATDLPSPQAVGTDRLCAAVAAYDRLGVACVVADCGTAITIDCVSAEGVFLGGAILPGLAMAAESLHQRTAQLPRVEPSEATWTFGKDTRQAIVGGILATARGALRELVESYATELGQWPIVILTGGDAHLICPHPGDGGLVQAIVPDLAVRGAAMAYYNSLLP